MEQLNNVLPVSVEENQPGAANSQRSNQNSPLLKQVRQKFGIFGGISLIFGITFAFCFYKAEIGLNALLFAIVVVILLSIIMNQLKIPPKRVTLFYYSGTILLGLSSMLTSSGNLQFINTVGMLLLLDLSILHQFHDDKQWDFAKHLGRMFGLAFSSIVAIRMPFVDSLDFLKKTRVLKTDRSRNIIIGVIIAFPLLWVIVALLSSADLLFGEITKQVYKFFFSSNIINVGLLILFGFLACYCIICGAAGRVLETENQKSRKKADSVIAVTAMALIGIVYAAFCSIQVIYLFANGLFILPEEFTFAEYARRGFFELLTVTVINIILMLICSAAFRESKILRFILTGITICTYIMIASATYRMVLYIKVYNLTFLRLFVLLFLLIDALVLAGVITSEYKKAFPLFGYCVTVVTICYLIFSFARPDYFIASYHINNKEELNVEDIAFLTQELSFDAAPIIIPLLSDPSSWSMADTSFEQKIDGRYLAWDSLPDYTDMYYEKIALEEKVRGIRDYNYSYYLASKFTKQYPRQ